MLKLPTKKQLTVKLDKSAFDFLHKTVSPRQQGDFVSTLLIQEQHRRQAEQRSRRRLAAVSRVSEGVDTWLYG